MTGFSLAQEVANDALKNVVAYKNFLKSNKTKIAHVSNQIDFQNLPVMEKNSYLRKYKFKDLFPDGKTAPMAYASSGSSGEPTFWFRSDFQEKQGGDTHELILSKIFGIAKHESTLVVVCFSMGVWVAGNYTLAAFREVARRGYALTVVTPGIEKNDIFSSLSSLAPHYKKIVLAGYPPFVMDVILEAKKKGIVFPKGTKVLTAGEKFSEEWRDEVVSQLRSRPTDVVSIYGCADVGVLGFETPLSIFIRRSAWKNHKLALELFGHENVTPCLVQFNPEQIYFEQIGSELAFTVNSAIPLIRYNIHDVGNIISIDEMLKVVRRHGINVPTHLLKWKWPFIVKKGRTDVALTFYALNIYPDHLADSLKDKSITRYINGNYFAFSKNASNQRTQSFHLDLEAAHKDKLKKSVISNIQKTFVNRLSKLNIEYRKLVDVIGSKAYPIIRIFPPGKGNFQYSNLKGLIAVSGKKPKVIT